MTASRPAILVTGGAGYIGSHTVIELLREGKFDVISVDNFSNSNARTLDRVREISGKSFVNYVVDAADKPALEQVFEAHPEIVGVIHFAAFKAVGESVADPLKYYENNLISLLNILRLLDKFQVKNFIFSSSCTVYGNIDALPVTEATPTTKAASPYGSTKLFGEQIIQDFAVAYPAVQSIALRYFNPVGAHESGKNGEDPINRPNNLVPFITQVASGVLPKLTVFGGDYPTRDGSCIRDYIHVTDVAIAHLRAFDYLLEGKNTANYEQYNLGAGLGVSVLEAIHAFEEVTGVNLNYEIGPRRPGDVVAIYSDSSLATSKFGWVAERDIKEMMRSAWAWQLHVNKERQMA
jgi:UDP-glucose 4-epimerase